MGSNVSRSVEIQISNKTRNITLKNPRTYFDSGRWSVPSLPELLPGSSGICHFLGSSSSSKVSGLLVYEANSFTLAIYFSNPTDHDTIPMELGLELSPGKAHLDSLVDTHTRMANGTYSSSRLDIQFDRGVVGKSHGTVHVSEGPVKVTATMSNAINFLLEVVLEEQGGMEKKNKAEKPCLEIMEKLLSLKTHVQEK